MNRLEEIENKTKDERREEVAKMTEEFLAKGGKVTVLEPSWRNKPKQIIKHKS